MIQEALFQKSAPSQGYGIVPRDYQHRALDETLKLWNDGIDGVLIRMATGLGKTITTCMLADEWCRMGDNYHVLIVSYEKQLVWQFAEEVKDVLGLEPGIEMESEEVSTWEIPKIVVATRQTLMQHRLATEEQQQWMREVGLLNTDLVTFSLAKRLHRAMASGGYIENCQEAVDEWNTNYRVNRDASKVSRVYKFDNQLNWLVAFDEAHKHAYKLQTVGHLVDWFGENPRHRRLGMTATPKRSDGVSIGYKMFPGVAIDYPLSPDAVQDGWAVPYKQRYILVESIDFGEIKALAGNSQKKWDAEVAKRLETELAKVCQPLLDMVDDRQTLIFSPKVDFARQVAQWINARVKVRCVCGKPQWFPRSMIGDGAVCLDCKRVIEQSDIVVGDAEQAVALWGEVPPRRRAEVYREHQHGKFQFLSVCALCREGYDDPGISCVAVFRPVSKKASSLAEQMKGRSCRPERGLLNGLKTPEERLEAIANSSKPDALIVDLTGITGLGDCPTTVRIYAEGEPDEVVDRAQKLVEGGLEDVQQAIEQAKEEIKEEAKQREQRRKEREAAARERAKQLAEARAKVNYKVYDRGVAGTKPLKGLATEKQLRMIKYLGMELVGWEPSMRQASRIIGQLNDGMQPKEVAYKNGIEEKHWQPATATQKQKWYMMHNGIAYPENVTSKQASDLIDAHKNPGRISKTSALASIASASTPEQLDAVGRSLAAVRSSFDQETWAAIVESGKQRRAVVSEVF